LSTIGQYSRSVGRGRRRHGAVRKRSYTVTLDPMAAANLRSMGRNNLSAGIELAEKLTRGMPEHRLQVLPTVSPNWLAFEVIDAPADTVCPGIGENLDPFRTALPDRV